VRIFSQKKLTHTHRSYHTKTKQWAILSASWLCGLSLSAQTILIDYDDGNPGNGIHDSSIRNGGFEDVDGSDFATTPYWESYFSEGNGEDPVLANNPKTGSLHGVTSGWNNTGLRSQLSQVIPAADWTIQATDSFQLNFYLRSGANLDALDDKFDEAQLIIDVVNSNGNPVLHNGSALLLQQNFPITRDNNYSLASVITQPIPADSTHIGHQLRFRILVDSDRDESILIDDVTLIANPTVPTPLAQTATPNIVLIYADDVGYGDVSCYGSGIVPTPRINSIAEDGIRFTDVHSPASTCTPSRYSMLTGEYAWRTPGTGIATGVSPLLIRAGSVTLPSMLQQAGYKTAAIGKWHLGLGSSSTDYNTNPITPGPLDVGFDYWFGIPATNDRVPCVYMENRAIVNLDPTNDPIQVSYSGPIGNEPTGASNPELLSYYTADPQHNNTIINGISRIGYMDGGVAARWVDEDHADIFAAKADNFIQENVATGQPFFLYLASPDIHVPRAPHQRFQGQSTHGWRGDAMLQLDWSVGAILDRLADPNNDGDSSDSIVENTLVIFTSDNGPVGNDGYDEWGTESSQVSKQTYEFSDGHDSNSIYTGGKYSVREGGTRVPCLVRWPGTITAGTVSDALFSHTDFMATLAALTGQPLPTDAGPDSENVLPALIGQSTTGRSVLVTQNNNQWPKALRRDNWKYFEQGSSLYNLDGDPDESNNIATSNPIILSELQTIFSDSVNNTPMLANLLGWWPFDETQGDEARDISGPNRKAALTGTPIWMHEAGLSHLNFDGIDDAAQIIGLPTLDADFTITTWARSSATNFQTSGALLSRRPAFALTTVAGSKQLEFTVYSDANTPQLLSIDLATISGFDSSQWHHYAASYDASTGTATIFIDGIQQATANMPSGPANADTGPVFLGSDEGTSSFSGDLSDTRIYGTLLSPQRIANTASSRLDDSDADGILSDWEHRNTLNPFNSADAATDIDNDSISNLEEFQNNSSPILRNAIGGLLAHWALDETSSDTASDNSGNQYSAALINSPAWTSAAGRQFISFNGSNQYINVSSMPNLNNEITVACWARSDFATWNIAGALISRRPQFVLHPWKDSTRLSFTVFHGGSNQHHCEFDLNNIPGFDLTEWHHYAGTYKASTGNVRLYVDGILQMSTFIAPQLLDVSTNNLQIGKDVDFNDRYLAGDIDETKVFYRALTDDEIINLMEGFDDDQDGLDDAFERQLIHRSGPHTTLVDVSPSDDPDMDGSDNLEESIAGTDPLDSSKRFKVNNGQLIENEGSRRFSTTLNGYRGRSYKLMETTSLVNPNWSIVDTYGPLARDEVISLNRHELSTPQSFYRVDVSYEP